MTTPPTFPALPFSELKPEWQSYLKALEAWGRQGWAEKERLEAENQKERSTAHAMEIMLHEAEAERNEALAVATKAQDCIQAIAEALGTMPNTDTLPSEIHALRAQVRELAEALVYARGGFDLIYDTTRKKSEASNAAAHHSDKIRAALAKVPK